MTLTTLTLTPYAPAAPEIFFMDAVFYKGRIFADRQATDSVGGLFLTSDEKVNKSFVDKVKPRPISV